MRYQQCYGIHLYVSIYLFYVCNLRYMCIARVNISMKILSVRTASQFADLFPQSYKLIFDVGFVVMS